ncbi:MAG: hypothetical protein OIF50_07520 [Flavobacteriaceae bacterium]|nr:hypothetical protein [Flavobacteriaceae bacterium]
MSGGLLEKLKEIVPEIIFEILKEIVLETLLEILLEILFPQFVSQLGISTVFGNYIEISLSQIVR